MTRGPRTSHCGALARRAGCLPLLVAAVLAGTLSWPATATATELSARPNASVAAPGDLISAEPMTAYVSPFIPMDARAWRIRYRSTTVDGQPTEVSGTVLVPTVAYRGPGPRPLIGYAVGSQGLADRCAPSRQLAAGSEYEGAQLAAVLAKGWAIALTDYPGLGTPGDHSYVVGHALGRAVLDAIRAARRLPGTGLDPQGPLGVFGYSEGGNAAGWAIQLQPAYAPELTLAGAAVGAAPSQFPELATTLDGGLFAFLLLYAAIGFDASYPELQLDRYLNAFGRDTVARYRDTCLPEAIALGLLLPKHVSAYSTSNPLATPEWIRRLTENNLGGIAPETPVLLGAARLDEVIPHRQMLTVYRQWCALGVDAHFHDILIGEHITGSLFFAPRALDFLADRFAGKSLIRAADCR
jgi:hypothetical protein